MGNRVSAPNAESNAESEQLAAARVRRENAATQREEAEASRILALTKEDVLIKQQEAARIAKEAARIAEARQRSADARQRANLLFAASVAIATALAVDWVVHGYAPFIKWRMKRRLLGASPQPAKSAYSPAPTSFLPVMLYGPTGCSKSFAMAQLARQLQAAGVPVATVRFRVPPDKPHTRSGKRGESAVHAVSSGTGLMQAIAASVCDHVGYLRREPLVSAFQRGITIRAGDVQLTVNAAAERACNRTIAALAALFDVAQDVCAAQSSHAVATAPVLMFDEVHDLIRNDRLRRVGGMDVFSFLGTRFVTMGTDGNTRIIAAGSSFEFARQLALMSPLINTRRKMVQMQDPSPQVISDALKQNGYSNEDVNVMLSLCGPRFRLLDGPLNSGPAACPVAEFVSDMTKFTLADLRNLFAAASEADALVLGRLLDAIVDADERGYARPTILAVSEHFLELQPSKVLYWDGGELLHFQSALVRTVWTLHRADIMTDYASSKSRADRVLR